VHLLAESIGEHAQRNAGRYDVVCAFQVLEHVAAPRSFLSAAVRCLRPNGRLMVSVPGEDSFAGFAHWDILNMPPHHVTRWTDDCLRTVASLYELHLVEIVPEPLGRNMRRAYAKAHADRYIAERLKLELKLLDARIRKPLFSALATGAAGLLRRYLALTPKQVRRGHAVLAVYARGQDAASLQ
jgi:SAM-dependent methyltransferase